MTRSLVIDFGRQSQVYQSGLRVRIGGVSCSHNRLMHQRVPSKCATVSQTTVGSRERPIGSCLSVDMSLSLNTTVHFDGDESHGQSWCIVLSDNCIPFLHLLHISLSMRYPCIPLSNPTLLNAITNNPNPLTLSLCILSSNHLHTTHSITSTFPQS